MQKKEAESAPANLKGFVAASNRAEAVGKLIREHPTLQPLYSAGPHNDGKGGWVNAIKDQRASAYRLLFYLERLPLAPELGDVEAYTVLYGNVLPGDAPNFPRVLFTTTGGVNLIADDLPGPEFAAAVRTNSLEIVPLTFERDRLTSFLRESHYAYICMYDEAQDALRILDLADYIEVMVAKDKKEVVLQGTEHVVAGDAKWIWPFYLRYVIKSAE